MLEHETKSLLCNNAERLGNTEYVSQDSLKIILDNLKKIKKNQDAMIEESKWMNCSLWSLNYWGRF
jgi:hypothetical protein